MRLDLLALARGFRCHVRLGAPDHQPSTAVAGVRHGVERERRRLLGEAVVREELRADFFAHLP